MGKVQTETLTNYFSAVKGWGNPFLAGNPQKI